MHNRVTSDWHMVSAAFRRVAIDAYWQAGRRRTSVFFAAALLVGAAACPPVLRADEPKTADEIIARYVEAIGGQQKIDSVKTVRVTGKRMFGEMETPIMVEIKIPNKVRIEFSLSGMTGVQAFDGEEGWLIMPFSGRTDPEKMPDEMVKLIKEQTEPFGPLVNYKKKGHQVELIGKEEEEGTEVYNLKVVRKNGHEEYHYLDSEHFLAVKLKAKREFQGTEFELSFTFGDYKEVDGLLFAHAMEQSGSSFGGGTTVWEKVELNVDIPDERFAMPEVKTDGDEAEEEENAPGADDRRE